MGDGKSCVWLLYFVINSGSFQVAETKKERKNEIDRYINRLLDKQIRR